MNVWVLTYLNSVGADSVWVDHALAQDRAHDLGTQGVETILEPFDVIGVSALNDGTVPTNPKPTSSKLVVGPEHNDGQEAP